MADLLSDIFQQIISDETNNQMTLKGYLPVYTASNKSRIVIIGQAPGRKAQETMKPWNDKSGEKLRSWLGVTEAEFYDPDLFAIIPMDFYYPGKGSHGDIPPRVGFAKKWHPKIFAQMPDVQLIILVGNYAQKYYLGSKRARNLTETVLARNDYLPEFFPIVHPSPLNFRWQKINPWFESEAVPELRQIVRRLINN